MKRMMMIALAAFALACGSKTDYSNYTLSGAITDAPENAQVYLEHLTAQKVTALDTAVIAEDGSFGFDIQNEEVGFYRLVKDNRSFITLIINPGEVVVVNTDWNLGISKYTVEGSEESSNLVLINEMMSAFFGKRDSLTALFQANQNDPNMVAQLQNEYMTLVNNNAMVVKEFIKENPSSLACLAAAEQLNPDEDFEYFKMVDEGLGSKYANSDYYKEFHTMVARLQQLAVGTMAPDIILPNQSGEPVSLSSLRGKVVLVDFWASWCKPCRMENPNVVRAYAMYKEKGFEIFGVSLDKNREDWLRAIDQDRLYWTQVSDLQFWNSSVVRLYDIKGIPFALLLDQEGKIIAKNLRGQALLDKLEEILNS